MSEDSIKTAEEQLHALINESNLVLTNIKTESNKIFSKLRKTINVLIVTGSVLFLAFLYSLVEVNSRIATLESSKVSKEVLDEKLDKYSLKTGVIFFQNNMYDMNKAYFQYKPMVSEQNMELTYTKALKQFNEDVSRGDEKQIN